MGRLHRRACDGVRLGGLERQVFPFARPAGVRRGDPEVVFGVRGEARRDRRGHRDRARPRPRQRRALHAVSRPASRATDRLRERPLLKAFAHIVEVVRVRALDRIAQQDDRLRRGFHRPDAPHGLAGEHVLRAGVAAVLSFVPTSKQGEILVLSLNEVEKPGPAPVQPKINLREWRVCVWSASAQVGLGENGNGRGASMPAYGARYTNQSRSTAAW